MVQGFGAVGRHAARFLRERGAVLVGASDSKGSIYDSNGLDIEALVRTKAKGNSVAEVGAGEARDRDAVLDMECEVWIPAARPDVVTEKNAHLLRAKIVAQGANIPLTPGAEASLADRGVVVLPDFIANAGGVISAAVEVRGGSADEAFANIERKIRANVERMLVRAHAEGVPPRQAALALAEERVRAAMGYGRWRYGGRTPPWPGRPPRVEGDAARHRRRTPGWACRAANGQSPPSLRSRTSSRWIRSTTAAPKLARCPCSPRGALIRVEPHGFRFCTPSAAPGASTRSSAVGPIRLDRNN